MKVSAMTMDQQNGAHLPPAERVTRCQLAWAILFLVVFSASGWLLVVKLLF